MTNEIFVDFDFKRDVKYWNQYYKKNIKITPPSLFALFVSENYLTKNSSLLELGCGNGRDSFYFASQGLNITAVDASDYVINKLIQRNVANIKFFCGDFVESNFIYSNQYDYCYSRFSVHAISAVQEDLLLTNVKKSLKSNGKFFIEVRSINDPLFGKGIPVPSTTGKGYLKNCFIYDGHFRRFIVKEELEKNLTAKGYKIEYSEEKTGFAPFCTEDPPIIRVIVSV